MKSYSGVAVPLWLFGLAVALAIVLRTPFTTDMSAFLPSSPEPAQQALVAQLRDGVASRLILVGIEGATEAVQAEISRRMSSILREKTDLAMVDNGQSNIGGADQDYVWRNRYLLSPAVTAEHFSVEGLHKALEADLDLLSSGLEPLLKDSITRDPTAEILALAGALADDAHRTMRNGIWTSPDGAHALILVQTRAPGFDIDAQENAQNEIDAAFTQAQQALGADGAHLIVTGPGIFGVKTRAAMKHDVTLYSTVAMATIVVLLLATYRSALVLGLTLVPVITGALAGLAAVSLRFGFVHGVTIGFGITLIGEAVDYAVYLFTQTAGQGGAQSTLRRIWPTLRLGVLVSICGFAAMLFSSFTGFVQLGIFTITGLAVAVCVTRFILPNLLPTRFPGTREVAFAPPLLRLVQRAHRFRWPLVILLVAAIALIVARRHDLWQDDLASMSPISAADQRVDSNLRRDIGAPDVRHIIVATAPDRQKLLEASERTTAILRLLVPTGALSGFDAPDRYLPSDTMQRMRQTAMPDKATLERNMTSALEGLPFQPDIFGPFFDDVAIARQAGLLSRKDLDNTALSLKLDSLLIEQSGHWVGIIPLRGVKDPKRIAEALSTAREPDPDSRVEFLDLKIESDHLLHRYRQEALLLAVLGSAVIAALLLIAFRSFRKTFTVLAPLGAAVILTVAILTFHHRQLSIFNLFGLLLVVAVGSNYCLFFQRGGLTGEEGRRTVTSLLVANICTVVGFGALSLSHIPVLYGIGGTVAIGTALSLIAGAILSGERKAEPPPHRPL